jgi:transketolase
MEAIYLDSVVDLETKAKELRKSIINMIYKAGSGHPGGSLSIIDILTVLYYHEMKIKPDNPEWFERDRFILSKGHAAPALYAILAAQGYFPSEELSNLRKIGSILQGHPDKNKTPGIDMTTGSLGQGLSIAIGMALAGKLDKADYRVYAVIGDGECQEGQIWEAALAARHYSLDNLTVFLDFNKVQLADYTEKIMSLEPIVDKWKAFGWYTMEIDGHNMGEIIDACSEAREHKGEASIIIANTIKGKGISYMENKAAWHGKAPNEEEFNRAMNELK